MREYRTRLARVMVVALLCALSSTPLAQQVPVAVPSSSELAGPFLWQSAGLHEPVAVAITQEGLVAVADGCGEIVGLCATDGSRLWKTSTAGTETLVKPAGIAALADGSLLVADARRRCVDHFSSRGEWVSRFAPAVAFGQPTSIAVGSLGRAVSGAATQCVALVDEGCHEIILISAAGEELRRISRESFPMKDGSRALPSQVAFVGSGLLAVSASEQHEIFILDLGDAAAVATGAPTVTASAVSSLSWGGRGPFPGLFNHPMGLAGDGEWLWIADQFNHRIARQSHAAATKGEGKLAYGQHAVFPRAGEGAVHYPVSIAVARDVARGAQRGALAVVCEPFERRVQAFEPRATEEPADLRLVLPKLEGVQSHFGGSAARAGKRLFLHDPESATIVVFDLSRGQPIHVSTLSGAGVKPHETGRIDAMVALNEGRRLLIADGANQRLALFELTAPPAEVIFEPFMGKLVKTRSYARLDLPRDATIVSIAQSDALGIVALCCEGPRIVTLDRSLRIATTLPITAPDTTASAVAIACADDALVGVLFDKPAVICLYRFADNEWKPAGIIALPATVNARNLAAGPAGQWWVVDAMNDSIVVCRADGTTNTLGSSGVADGMFWLPGACARGEGGEMYVVDTGNHRGQEFTASGEWKLTFSLGRTYTRPRTADEVLKIRKKPDAPAVKGATQ